MAVQWRRPVCVMSKETGRDSWCAIAALVDSSAVSVSHHNISSWTEGGNHSYQPPIIVFTSHLLYVVFEVLHGVLHPEAHSNRWYTTCHVLSSVVQIRICAVSDGSAIRNTTASS